MLAIDTNVIVRLLTGDDPVQLARAQALIAANDVWVSSTVLLETAWVLSSTYRYGKPAVVGALGALVGLPRVTLQNRSEVLRALSLMSEGMDLADALHLAAADGCDGFVTFDKALIRKAAQADLRLTLREP